MIHPGWLLYRSPRVSVSARIIDRSLWTRHREDFPQGTVWRVWAGRLFLKVLRRATGART